MATKSTTNRPYKVRNYGPIVPSLMISASIILAAYFYSIKAKENTKSSESVSVVAEFDTASVPVPTEVILKGTKGTEIHLTQVRIPRHQLPDDVIYNSAELSELEVLTDLPAKLPLIRSNFARLDGSRNAVIDRIPHGMRAMTLSVDETSSVEGWASSGAIVDVLLIQNDRTSVVAERVKIISAERSIQPATASEGEAPLVPKTVTILVTQEQCLAISTAMAHGKIAFALRSRRDEESWRDRYFLAERLKDGGVANPDSPQKISGLVTIGDKKFALINDRWIPAESVPDTYNAVANELSKQDKPQSDGGKHDIG